MVTVHSAVECMVRIHICVSLRCIQCVLHTVCATYSVRYIQCVLHTVCAISV